MEDLRQSLTETLDEAEWSWLIPHASRDALIVVDPSLDIVEVGMALATDNKTAVQRWIHEALIAKPSEQQMNDWEHDRSHRFTALIIQPFVLMQDRSTAS